MCPEAPRSPIFIVGAHKSGTSLLRSLLDGHSELSVLPREPHFFERSGLDVRYPLRRTKPAHTSHEEFGRRVAGELAAEGEATNPYSDSPDWHGYDPRRFLEDWQATVTTDLRSRYSAYLVALWAAAAAGPARGRFVDKSTEYLEFVPTLRSWFPDARFLHMVRNPYANLIGIRRYHAKMGGVPRLRASVRSIALSFDAARAYSAQIHGYHVVKLEDLIASTEETMRDVATTLAVPFTASLLTPTISGMPWTGNSVDDVRLPEVRQEPTRSWQQELHPLDVGLINAAIAPDSTLGYERLDTSTAKHRWRASLPGETVPVWAADRVVYLLRRTATKPPRITEIAPS
jgi:hypothetical protein